MTFPQLNLEPMATLNFSDFSLNNDLQKALADIGYKHPTPIQEQTIDLALKGHDILGIAQTGTGKTAAFCLPIIHNLNKTQIKTAPKSPRALILTPTRELAIQIHDNLNSYGQFLNQKYTVIFGGVSQGKQVNQLRNGVDILVATPGRLLDLINQKHLSLKAVESFVLDEADRMLDMGFMKEVEKIIKLMPKVRHNLFFSATMPPKIQTLANNILYKPKKIEVTPQATTVEKIQQTVMYVEKSNKVDLLIHLLKSNKKHKTLVFISMKHMANRVATKLEAKGIATAVIHGNKSQSARQKALQNFTRGDIRVMLATDIASRGIDIEDITHVINFELSHMAEVYVHRIGRTARAGTEGKAISLVTGEEKSFLAHIEKTIRHKIAVDKEHPFHSEEASQAPVMGVGKAKASLEAQFKKARRQHFRQKPKANVKKATTRTSRPSTKSKRTAKKRPNN